jgi:hypothetical protein
MLGPSRPLPQLGAAVRILHFGGGREDGVIVELSQEGRLLVVRSSSGELVEFALNPASARFVAAGPAGGPRLELLGRRGAPARHPTSSPQGA